MVETKASVIVPAPPEEVFDVVSDLEHADWLPGVRALHRLDGPTRGVGARFDVEAGLIGRHLRGILGCTEYEPPRRVVMTLEQGMDLTMSVDIEPVDGGSNVVLRGVYEMGSGPFAATVERATQGAARREIARAAE